MAFRREFYIALNNWQKGWEEVQETREEFALKLKEECLLIDNSFKVVTAPCYRKRFLHREELIDIIYNNEKNEGVTSWTVDVKYAEFFKGKCRDGVVTAAIFEHKPEPHEVIVNINELWNSEEFISELNELRATNPEYCDAIDYFKDIQGEVVLEVPLKGSEICILSGISSSFDDICDIAGVPEEDRPKVYRDLVNGGAFIEEVTYVRDDDARNAIRNTLTKFNELLQSVKR